MTDDRMFIGIVTVLGVLFSFILAFMPQSRAFPLPPYFWVLIAMGAVEILLSLRRGRGFQPAVTMQARIIALALAIGAMLLIPYLAGVQTSIL